MWENVVELPEKHSVSRLASLLLALMYNEQTLLECARIHMSQMRFVSGVCMRRWRKIEADGT